MFAFHYFRYLNYSLIEILISFTQTKTFNENTNIRTNLSQNQCRQRLKKFNDKNEEIFWLIYFNIFFQIGEYCLPLIYQQKIIGIHFKALLKICHCPSTHLT